MTLEGLSMSELVRAMDGKVIFGSVNGASRISIDSRKASRGEIFLALKGERFDGHDFVNEALRNADGAIVSIPPAAPPAGKFVIHVKNTLKALHDMANYVRRKYSPIVVGITGTNGKTTTKEMTASILSTRYTVLKNTGNLNNQVGLPMSLMDLGPLHEAAVLEMGASAPGDIRELCTIAEPGYGVITNIGHAHIEGFRDIGMVRSAKMELLDSANNAAVNADDAFLMEGISGYAGRLVLFSVNAEADIRARDIDLQRDHTFFTLDMAGTRMRVRINVPGLFNVYNALAASAAAHMLGMDAGSAAEGLASFRGVPMRVELKDFHGALVINDVYNANPSSMEEALKELIRLRGERAIAVLGDMLELGDYSEAAHRRLGQWMSRFPIDLFIAVGPLMRMAAQEFTSAGGRAVLAEDSDGARAMLAESCGAGDTVLVKGSRFMRMERVVNGDGGAVKTEVSG